MRSPYLILLLLCFNTALLYGQSSLDNIQNRIVDAYTASLQTNEDQFNPIIEELTEAYADSQDHLTHYWLCFAYYRYAVYLMNNEQVEQAKQALTIGIEQLKTVDDPDSEDLALLGSMISISIPFKPDLAPILSAEASKYYHGAIEKNGQNLRAFLGVGRSDYYKPKRYGGGMLVEDYLKQALSKPIVSSDTPNAPTWGKADVYYYLASYYAREDRLGEAKLYCRQGTKAYPDHYRLQRLLTELQ